MFKSNAKDLFNKQPNIGDESKVKIVATVTEEGDNKYRITVKKITSYIKGSNSEGDSGDGENGNNEEEGENEDEDIDIDADDETQSEEKEEELSWWDEKLDDLTNIGGHIKIKILDVILMIFDALQSAVNSIQTGSYNTNKLETWDVVMEITDITANQYKNQYVNYTEGKENLGTKEQKSMPVNEKNDGLREITTLPVIPVEFYTMAKGQIDIFDVNFLNGQNNTELHPETSKWLVIRNFVSVVMHMVIYIGAVALIIALIIHGVVIVSSTFTPVEKAKNIGDLNQTTKAVAMLVGAVLIMGICIFFSNSIFSSMKLSNDNELPIRVNVSEGKVEGEENKYSFSTNLIGYYRFMAQINVPRFSDDKSFYVVIYIVLVLINTLAVLVMFCRLVILAFLSIIGPIIAIAIAFNKKNIFGLTYQRWVINYVAASSIQLIMAIIYKIILEIGF